MNISDFPCWGFVSASLFICDFPCSRLQKTRLEKEDGERKLRDLQDSLLILKKQAPTSDSSARVIHASVARQSSDYIDCVGETVFSRLVFKNGEKKPLRSSQVVSFFWLFPRSCTMLSNKLRMIWINRIES